MSKDEHKQEAPIPFRPYPPIKRILKKYAGDNVNYYVNCAIGFMGGVPQHEIDKYARGLKDKEEK